MGLRSAKLDSFSNRLLAWFTSARRDLPWRQDRSAYRVVVSELMLQQTTVAAAAPHFLRFTERFPGWDSLARAPVEDVVAAWAGLGYYRRARNLHALARAVMAADGEFPREAAAALSLPGVGPYTAGAVLSLAFGIAVPAVDGNVARVLSRHRGQPWIAARVRDRRALETLVMELQPADAPGEFNEALMELGATTCTPRQPACPRCPVAADCVALREGRIAELPPVARRASSRDVGAVAALVEVKGRILLRRRPADSALLAGLWELPGGFHEDEPQEVWLAREILAPFGGGEIVERVGSVKHVITTRRITLDVWRCRLDRLPAASEDLAWVAHGEAESLGLSAGSRKALGLVRG